MKIAMIVFRTLLGLLYVVFSLAYFFNLMPAGKIEGPMLQFVSGLDAARYVMPVVKSFELIAGACLLLGRFTPLASVVLFPITLNIFLFHLFLAPDGIAMGAVMLMANLFVAYYYREQYKPLLSFK